MPVRLLISCITRAIGLEPHNCIEAIGGETEQNSRWRLALPMAVAGIESGRWAFYVEKTGHQTDVVIATGTDGTKYLKATTDGARPETLLALPECEHR